MHFHVPVMVDEVVRGLVTDPRGLYLDATVGGGGHSRAILQVLEEEGRLIGVDRDPEAVSAASCYLAEYGERATVVQGTFSTLGDLLDRLGVRGLQGVLFDLGVSSHQLDSPQRGFSFREEGPLDMRMDPSQGLTAATWIAQASEDELERVIREYGEERQARRIARTICQFRERRPLESTTDLRLAVERARPGHLIKTLARVFQAIRIAVNGELEQLKEGLETAVERLLPGGRLAAIAYHSLEDRLVKTQMAALVRGCICPPGLPVCACGRKPTFRKVQARARRANAGEIDANLRARSAVLRIYEKL